MNSDPEFKTRAWEPSKAELALSVVFGVLFIAEIIVCFIFFYNACMLDFILYIGWVLMLSAMAMMTLPRYALREKGNIPEGKSWVHTTALVDTGIYGVVRHPIYVGWNLSNLAMMFISQHWITILVGVLPFIAVLYYIQLEDRNNIEKFGESYIEYSQRVPMMNFIGGFARYIRRD